ncbi:MAG: MBL fold metallo-hydrolase [Ilumatobacter sp.]|nr:MAG: MBL fold metallo-hydrolase [Ilumatobacter sp.]
MPTDPDVPTRYIPGEGVEVTGEALWRAWIDRVEPPVEQVTDGLWSIPVPMPDNPLRYVLVYALETVDGIVIVDAGWPTDEAWQGLVDGCRTAGFDVADVRGVLVTHIHPDHVGLASRVREASGAWIAMHPADAALLHDRYGDIDDLMAAQRELMAWSGIPEHELNQLSEASVQLSDFISLREPDVLLEDGDTPDVPGWNLRAVWTPGHSPGHLCFHEPDRRWLFSGDHVLPRITPNISAHAQQTADPLTDYYRSLHKVRALDTDEVFPAHEYRFRGLGARVDHMIEHHEERLDEIVVALETSPGLTTWDLSRGLTWSRSWSEIPAHMRRAANGETLAHLQVLEHRSRVSRRHERPVRWFAD